MKAIFAVLMVVPVAMAAVIDSATSSNAQLVQSNVNVDSSANAPLDQAPESVTSQVAVQQEILQVGQDSSAPSVQPPSSPQVSVVPVAPVDPQTVQLLKEANAQYQYQINSRYEEKTRPIYGDVPHRQQQQYNNQPYQSNMYLGGPAASASAAVAYPYYKENVQYQELGNGQRRAETVLNDNVRTQYENQDAYNHQRSQSYLEYGKGELSPDYNTYSYKRTYY